MPGPTNADIAAQFYAACSVASSLGLIGVLFILDRILNHLVPGVPARNRRQYVGITSGWMLSSVLLSVQGFNFSLFLFALHVPPIGALVAATLPGNWTNLITIFDWLASIALLWRTIPFIAQRIGAGT